MKDPIFCENQTEHKQHLLEIWFLCQLITAIMHLLAVSSVLKWMYTNTHSSKLFFIHSGADVLQVICMLNNVNTALVAWFEIRAWHIELNELNTTKHVLSLKGRLMSTSLKQRSMLLVKHLWKYKTLINTLYNVYFLHWRQHCSDTPLVFRLIFAASKVHYVLEMQARFLCLVF